MPVVHIGNDPGGAGGIASVIRGHLALSGVAGGVHAWPSYRAGSSRIEQLRLALGVAARIVGCPPCAGLVFHFHLSQKGSLFREGGLLWLARLRGHRRLVVTLHGSSLFVARPVARWMVHVATWPATRVHALASLYGARLGLPADATVVIPNDVKVPRSTPPLLERPQELVFAGEVGMRKGIDVLLAAWQAAGPPENWSLALYGPIERGFSLGDLPVRVEYRGPVSNSTVLAALGNAQGCVLPSRAEAFPVIICEAMAHGCPVIATRVGAVEEMLPGLGGSLLVKPGDREGLCAAIVQLTSDPTLRLEMAAAAQDAVGRFESSVVQEQWRHLYESLAR